MNFNLGKPTRQAYGETLVELGEKNPDIVVLDADLSKSTYTYLFAEKYPDRFFNVGIQEANMVGIAAGLASVGKIPFISSFASFLMCKAFDQLRIAVAYSGFNVKIVTSHGGISLGEDGVSQMAHEDLGLATLLPNFAVLVPADEFATRKIVNKSANYPNSVYIRTSRPKSPIIYNENEDFEIGGCKVLRDGKDVTIIAYGLLVSVALEASEILSNQGIDAAVIDCYCLKPLDEKTIIEYAKKTKMVVVCEEHLKYGGLGSIISMTLSEKLPVRMEFVNLDDTYAESGKPEELFKKYKLTAEEVVNKVKLLKNR